MTFAAPGSSAVLSSPTAATSCDGLASITATANTLAGTYSVTASAAGVAPPASFSLTNTAGAAQAIAFVEPPADTPAGSAMTPPVAVSLKDGSNNPIVDTSVTLTCREAA